jgi:hypothetical protein
MVQFPQAWKVRSQMIHHFRMLQKKTPASASVAGVCLMLCQDGPGSAECGENRGELIFFRISPVGSGRRDWLRLRQLIPGSSPPVAN